MPVVRDESLLAHYKRRERMATGFFLLPSLFFICVFSYISFVLTFILAFYKVDWLSPWQFVGFDNFVKVVNYDLFWKSIRNVALYTAETVTFGLIAGLLIATLMEQKIKGLGIFRVAFFMPLVVSAGATAWIFRLLLTKGDGPIPVAIAAVTGLLSHAGMFDGPKEVAMLTDPKLAMTGVAMMTMWAGLGYWILIYTAGLRSIDPELYESAMIDGAGYWRRTLHVTVPLLRPVMLFLSITGIIGAFNLFAHILILPPYGEAPGGPDDALQVPILLIYNIAFGQRDFGYASALAFVVFLILLILTAIQAKFGGLFRESS
jgi:multiple sugar transport system permease protein